MPAPEAQRSLVLQDASQPPHLPTRRLLQTRLRAPCPGPGGLSSLQTSFRSGPRAALSFVLDLREVAGDWKPLLTGDVSAPS